jgi:hypothetical protein
VFIVSAGNLFGSIWNTVLFGGLWVVLGYAIDKVTVAMNTSMKVLPSLQDAANGFTVMQWIWSMLLIVMFFVIWMNYLFNENSMASGGV